MDFPDGSLLLDGEAFHEPAELLRRDAPGFGRIARPLEAAALEPLVDEQEAISLPQESLDTAARPSMDFLMSVRPQAR